MTLSKYLETRNKYSNAARKENAFKVYQHYRTVFDKVTDEKEKRKVIDCLKKITTPWSNSKVTDDDGIIIVLDTNMEETGVKKDTKGKGRPLEEIESIGKEYYEKFIK